MVQMGGCPNGVVVSAWVGVNTNATARVMSEATTNEIVIRVPNNMGALSHE